MKNLQKLCAAAVLTLMLELSAFAGQIDIPKTPPPPSASSSASTGGDTVTPNGYMECGLTSTDSVTQAALSLLQSMLPLF